MWTIPFRFEWRNLLPALAELRGAAVRIDAPPVRLGEPCPGEPRSADREALIADHRHLLEARLALLGLEAGELTRSCPLVFERLRDRCSGCESPDQCARDLADALVEEDSQEWRDYCRNAGTLRMLSAVQAAGSDYDADARRVVGKEALHRE